jgi:hypothetical protein
LVTSSKKDTESRTVKPRDGVDRDEKKDQSTLTKQTRASEKKCARRRIHEIVLPGTKEKDFIAGEHALACLVPQLVIKNGAAPEITQQWKHGKQSRHHDEENQRCTESRRVVEPTVES